MKCCELIGSDVVIAKCRSAGEVQLHGEKPLAYPYRAGCCLCFSLFALIVNEVEEKSVHDFFG